MTRSCIKCESDYTYIDKSGYAQWYNTKDGWICNKCRNIDRNSKRINFQGKQTFLGYNPRIGVCNICRAVYPFDTSLTHMHHESYHKDNPLKDSIEMCIRCHIKTIDIFGLGRGN